MVEAIRNKQAKTVFQAFAKIVKREKLFPRLSIVIKVPNSIAIFLTTKHWGFVYNLQLTNEKQCMLKEQYKQYAEVLNNSMLVNQMPIDANMFKP